MDKKENTKILIVCFSNLRSVPYISSYTNILESLAGEEVLKFDEEVNGEVYERRLKFPTTNKELLASLKN